MSFAVTQRTREIGVRIAMGANTQNILRLVLERGLRLAALGLAMGSVVAVTLNRVLISFLAGVHGIEITSIAVPCAVLICIAFAACYVPSRRAARLDPLAALRHD
jgi:ABC-type antimicrobial peptide transport system permease subunit